MVDNIPIKLVMSTIEKYIKYNTLAANRPEYEIIRSVNVRKINNKIELKQSINDLMPMTFKYFDKRENTNWTVDTTVLAIIEDFFPTYLRYLNKNNIISYAKYTIFFNGISIKTQPENARPPSKSKHKRYYIFGLAVGTHKNLLIYDDITKMMHHFEPHGSGDKPDILGIVYRTMLKNYFKSIGFPILKFESPQLYCPKIGLQRETNTAVFRNRKNNTNEYTGTDYDIKIDLGGYCTIWCYLYIDHFTRQPELDPIEIQDAMSELTTTAGYTYYIRQYTLYLINLLYFLISRADKIGFITLRDMYKDYRFVKCALIVANKECKKTDYTK